MKKAKAKRYIAILALCCAVVGVMLVFAPKVFQRHLAVFPQDATVSVYCRNTELPSINMGNGYLVQCAVTDVYATLAQCDGVDGISVRYPATEKDFYAMLNHFDVMEVSRYEDGALVAVCGYSSKILGGVMLDGEKVNVQVAFDGETLTVGYPLILDSY